MTRTGKIARLPADIRETINMRLHNGHVAGDVIDWLNEQPAVNTVLEKEFGGEPISAANMTSWKQGGYREWLQGTGVDGGPCRGLASFMNKINSVRRLPTPCLTDEVALFLSATLAMECDALDSITDDKERQKALGELLDAYAQLRGADLDGSRCHVERQKFQNLKVALEKHLKENQPKPQRTGAETQAIIRRILSTD